MDVTAVILGAGRATRMRRDKLLVPFGSCRLIDRVLAAASAYPTVAVLSQRVAEAADLRCRVVVNHQPELGMAYSLQLADAAAGPASALLVFLADMPLVTAALAARVVDAAEAAGADVCYPVRDGRGGHPVLFGPTARERIGTLAGDDLRALRDDPALRRATVEAVDDGPYLDVDDEAALSRALALLGATEKGTPLV